MPKKVKALIRKLWGPSGFFEFYVGKKADQRIKQYERTGK